VVGAACPSDFRSVIGRAEITEVIARTSRDLMSALRDGTLRVPVDKVYRFEAASEAFVSPPRMAQANAPDSRYGWVAGW